MSDEKQKMVVHVRVTADGAIAEDVATKIGQFLVEQGYELLEQSAPKPAFNEPEKFRVFLLAR